MLSTLTIKPESRPSSIWSLQYGSILFEKLYCDLRKHVYILLYSLLFSFLHLVLFISLELF